MLPSTPLQSLSSCQLQASSTCGIGYIDPRLHACRVFIAASIGDPIRGAGTGVPHLLWVSQNNAVSACGVGDLGTGCWKTHDKNLGSERYLKQDVQIFTIHDGRKMSNEIEQLKAAVQKLQETVTRLSGER
jgi:hypothetical protein